jgi:hypothetical protein
MKPRLHCFYSGTEIDPEGELRLINLWRRHNAAMGFEPIVLNEYHARQHPKFAELSERLSRIPTVNPAGYDLACYYRWIAMAAVGGGAMCDYDVFAFRSPQVDPTSVVMDASAKIRTWENIVPSLVTGAPEAFLDMATRFAAYTLRQDDLYDGKAHMSDMLILQRIAMEEPSVFSRVHVVRSWGDTAWDSAPFVHMCNAALGPKGMKPRWKHIPELIKQHKWAAHS